MSRPKPILIEQLSKSDLFAVRNALNEKDGETGMRLRDLFKRWQETNFDVRKMAATDHDLELELQNVCKVNLVPTSKGARLELRQEGTWGSYEDSVRNFPREPLERGKAKADRYRANLLFVSLLINPQRSALRGPCENCGQYYVNERIRPAKYLYCGPKCYGPGARNRKYREARYKRLEFAQQCLRQLKGQKDWREKLEEKLVEKFGVTPKWLTLALKPNGGLVVPVST